jgi:hypothetical protein
MEPIQVVNFILSGLFLSNILNNIRFIEYFIHAPNKGIPILLHQINGLYNNAESDDDDDCITDCINKIDPGVDEPAHDHDGDDDERADDRDDDDDDDDDDHECDERADDNPFTDIMVKGFFVYTNVLHQSYKFCDTLYKYHPVSKEVFDRLYYSVRCITAYYMNYSIEPFCKNWISVSIHTRSIYNEFEKTFYPTMSMNNSRLIEHIEPSYTATNPLLQMGMFARNIRAITPILQTAGLSSDTIDCMLLCYYENHYISKIVNPKLRKSIELDLNAPRSRVSFMLITFTPHSPQSSIELDLPRSMFYVGNEILSYAFIKRYLDRSRVYYIMDEEYTVKIMDNMMQTVELNNTQYILLNERSYTIMTNQSMPHK